AEFVRIPTWGVQPNSQEFGDVARRRALAAHLVCETKTPRICSTVMSDVTRILNAIQAGEPRAAGELLPLVYDELRRLAAQRLANEKPGQTLDATGLVHEAYLRLVDVPNCQDWNSRGHFFAAAAEAMRRILVERARAKRRLKRGGDLERVDTDGNFAVARESPDELLLINDAIDSLATDDPTAAQLVKLRYFAGLSVEDAAELVGIARSTAYEHWSYARAWLHRHVFDGEYTSRGQE
ncbi:MAG TPA: ECF-type sigma factor, partial [Pirellulales bacterium]|nr:ECF-type sigma factor [Pirellulales bacterium]